MRAHPFLIAMVGSLTFGVVVEPVVSNRSVRAQSTFSWAIAQSLINVQISKQPEGAGSNWREDAARFSESGDVEAELAVVSRAIESHPKDSGPLLYRCAVYLGLGEIASAQKDADAATAIDGTNANAWCTKGAIHMAGEAPDYLKARECYEKAMVVNPKFANGWHGRGIVSYVTGAYEDAIPDLSKAIALQGGKANYYVDRGVCLQLLRRHQEAIADFNSALSIDQDSYGALVSRGRCFNTLKEYGQAIKDFDRALELVANDGSLFVDRATSHAARGDFEAAEKDIASAIELDNADAGKTYKLDGEEVLSPAAMKHAEEQLRAMLADRPEMARHFSPGDRLWNWTLRQLANTAAGEPIYWDSTPPNNSTAAHQIPTRVNRGAINLRPADESEKADPDAAFERLWAGLVYELHNISASKEFQQCFDDVQNGSLSKDEFVMRMARIELRAEQETRAFYAALFLPWARAAGMPRSDASQWTLHLDSTDEDSTTGLSDEYILHYSQMYELKKAESEVRKAQYGPALERLHNLLQDFSLSNAELARAHFLKGCCELGQGESEAALEDFKLAIKNDDRWANGIFFHLGERKRTAVEVAGDERKCIAGAHFVRALLLHQTGYEVEALRDLDKAISTDPDYTVAIELRDRLKSDRKRDFKYIFPE